MSTIVTDVTGPLAARLKTEREARGWSVAELAERSGVSRAMISKVERAEASPTAALLGKLSGAFGLTLSALLARAEQASGRLARALVNLGNLELYAGRFDEAIRLYERAVGIWCDAGEVALGDDRVGHLQQRSPVIALGLELALTRHRLLLMVFVVDRHRNQRTDALQ